MPLDPNKVFPGLETAVKEAVSFPTVSLTTPASGKLDEEGKSTLQNPEASERFKRLYEQGLNPLKPVIIANTEFIPVSDGGTPDSEGLKAQFGENNILSVNSVVKLFEIHRQVRKATIASAEKLIERVKGFDPVKNLDQISETIEQNLSDIVRDDMNQTVDAAIKMLSENSVMRIGTGSTFRKKKGSKSSSPLSAQSLSNSSSPVTGRTGNNRIYNSPYMRNLVESVILEKITFEIIKYMSGLVTLKDAAAKSWSIYESLEYTPSVTESSNGTSASKMVSLRDNPGENLIVAFAPDVQSTEVQSVADVTKSLTGISPSSDTSDISLFIQFFISAADSFLRPSETMSSVVNGSSTTSYNLSSNPVYSSDADIYNALSYFSSLSPQDLYSNYSYPEELAFLDYISTGGTPAEKLNAEAIENLYDYFPSSLSEIDIHGEMLATSLFNDCISIGASTGKTSDKNRIFYAAGGSIPSSITSLKNYYDSLLDYSDKAITGDSFEYEYKLPVLRSGTQTAIRAGTTPLMTFLSSKSSNSEDLSNHIPLESTQNISEYSHADPYLTGPEYFYDVALQRGDESLKEFRDFTSKYRDFASSYVEDVESMSKLDYLIPTARLILKDIGSEIMKAADEGDESPNIFLLSMLSWKGKTNAGIIDLMRSIYPGSFLNKHAQSYEGAGVGEKGFTSLGNSELVIAKYDHDFVQEGNRRAVRVASNSLIADLLVDGAGIEWKKIRQQSTDAHLNELGGRIKNNIQGNEYVEKDKNFLKVSEGKWLNKVSDITTTRPAIFSIYKQSGDRYGSGKNGISHEMYILDTGSGFSLNKSNPNLSIRKYLHNYYFVESGMIDSSVNARFNSNRAGEEYDRDLDGITYQGTSFELGLHHRLFLLFSYVVKLISKSSGVYIQSGDVESSSTIAGAAAATVAAAAGGGVIVAATAAAAAAGIVENRSDASIKITMNKNEIEGIAQAFIDVGSGEVSGTSISGHESKQVAYQNTREHLDRFIATLETKISKSAAYVTAPLLHAEQLRKQYDAAKSFIRHGDGTDESKLGISILKSNKVNAYYETLDLLSDEAVAQMYKSYVSTIKRAENSSFTREDLPNLNQMKLMMKVLSASGYGLQSIEKMGPKNICHIGITNSMLNTLRYEAHKEFNNREFLDSRRFCVNIFKRNELDSQILVYPKTFLFDSSFMLLDNDYQGQELNHIANYSDDWTLDNILDNIEFTQLRTGNFTDGQDPFTNLTSALDVNLIKGSDLMSQGVEKDLLINHLFDYAFKVYYRYALGIDLNENSFTLNPIRKISGVVRGGLTTTSEEAQGDYDNIVNQLTRLYPSANVNQKLASELFRTIEIVAENPGYALIDKLKKTLYPKKFDKVLSILINEKDFVLYTEAYDKEFSDVYKTDPVFSYTSRSSRSETKRTGKDANQSGVIEKYIRACEEDFPEVFSLYATVTILPEN